MIVGLDDEAILKQAVIFLKLKCKYVIMQLSMTLVGRGLQGHIEVSFLQRFNILTESQS